MEALHRHSLSSFVQVELLIIDFGVRMQHRASHRGLVRFNERTREMRGGSQPPSLSMGVISPHTLPWTETVEVWEEGGEVGERNGNSMEALDTGGGGQRTWATTG